MLLVYGSFGSTAVANDLAMQYLDGLRQRGWHDVALEYLETAREDPIVDRDFVERIDYERAITLSDMAKSTVRDSERTRLYAQAIELLQSYANEHRDTKFYYEAMNRAAKMLADQARGKLSAAQRLPEDAVRQREPLLLEAREKYESSASAFQQLLDACREKLESLPKGALSHQDPEVPATRKRLEMVVAESRFMGAKLLFEKAGTYSKNSKDFRNSLESAISAFTELNKDYKAKVVGFWGKLYQGHCYQELGRWEEALDCFGELTEKPFAKPEFRRLKARAYRYTAECLLAQGKLEEAIEECNDCLRDARGKESQQPEWLAVAFRLAEALTQQAAEATGSEAKQLNNEARQLMREVANAPGEFRTAAKAALASGSEVPDTDIAEYRTFDDAFSAAKDALDRSNSNKLAASLAANNNPQAEPDLLRQASENRIAAQKLFRRASRLASKRTYIEDVLATQYYLSLLYWEENRYAETAILGNHIARNYPDSRYAASAAKVALLAYERLYLEARDSGDDHYEADQLAAMAEYMSLRWADSPEAADAVNLLMQIALRDSRVDDARELLNRLPKDNRASAELTLGKALWSRYLQQTGGSAELDSAARQQRAEVADLLAQGYAGLKGKRSPDYQEATGILYYVQLLLTQGDAARAVEVMESPQVGPLAVLDKGLLEVTPEFEKITYQTALQAYLSESPPQREKAQAMMRALEEALGNGPESAEQLLRAYRSLGGQLQREIRESISEGDTTQAEALAVTFEDLLTRITERQDPGDWHVRYWIAQANLQLGEVLSGDVADKYLDHAEESLQAMLQEAASDSSFAPSPLAVLAVRKQLGDCQCAREDYDAAMNQYAEILKEKPNMLDLQRATAQMLQDWGKNEEKSEKLTESIRGAMPQDNRRNLVWGWLRLAKIVDQARQRLPADSPKQSRYSNLFFEARYNIALSRLYAAQVTDGSKRAEHLRAARKNVESMKRLYPKLGGPEWEQKFNTLLEQIEVEE